MNGGEYSTSDHRALGIGYLPFAMDVDKGSEYSLDVVIAIVDEVLWRHFPLSGRTATLHAWVLSACTDMRQASNKSHKNSIRGFFRRLYPLLLAQQCSSLHIIRFTHTSRLSSKFVVLSAVFVEMRNVGMGA